MEMQKEISMKRLGILPAVALAAFGLHGKAGLDAAAQEPAPGRTVAPADDGKLNVIAFGAHPDDCDLRAGGTAAKLAALGHRVRFVSITNGDAGHQAEGGGALAARRRAEAKEAGRRIGVDYVTLDHHDGELLPTLEPREDVIRQIRLWKADLVLAPRPNDYHPDHRYTGVLVQDAAYMVVVPNVTPDTPALRKNPVFMYFQDGFQRPNPFRPDVAISIDDVFDKKVDMLDAHVSQFYEWLPWVDGSLDEVPKDPAARKRWLRDARTGEITPAVREALVKWYGPERGKAVRHAEAFEICEYGTRPDEAMIRKLFPFLPQAAGK
jgi:LmbE family N-acetylglucosaminyl deacetylase